MEWPWLAGQAGTLMVPHIDAENLAELDGLVEGMAAAGQGTSRNELVAYNAYIELCWYWWPAEQRKIKGGPAPAVPEVAAVRDHRQ